MQNVTCFLGRGSVPAARVMFMALLVFWAVPGCPSPDGGNGDGFVFPVLPGSSTIDFLTTSDAAVGGQGLVRVTLVDPVSEDTTVAFTSSTPSVATVGATATIPAGSNNTQVAFTGVSVGEAEITATLDGSSRSASVAVVGAIRVTFISVSSPLLTGSSTTLGVGLNLLTPTDVIVSLSSSDPAVLAVPATVVVPAFDSFQAAGVTAGSPGTTTITATLGSSTVTETVTVVATPSVSDLFVFPEPLLLGSPSVLEITLNTTVNSATAVALSSSDPAVIAVPAGAVVPAGSDTGILILTPLAVGDTIITATLNGSSEVIELTVLEAPSVETLSISSQLQVGFATTLRVSLDARTPSDATVSLISSNPAVLPVPASVIILAGQRSASVAVTPQATGSTLITAALGTSSVTEGIVVVETSSLDAVNGPDAIEVGAISSVIVRLSVPIGTDTEVTFTSSDPAVLTVPASSMIAAGDRSTSVPIQGLAAGTATVEVAVLGATFILPVEVVAAPTILNVSADTISVGRSGFLDVFLDAVVAADTTITLTNSEPTVLDVPASAVVPAGEQRASVPITGVAASPPDATVTATLGASSDNTNVTVLP